MVHRLPVSLVRLRRKEPKRKWRSLLRAGADRDGAGRAEHAIARVAEAGDDVAMIVEAFVDRCGHDADTRMRSCQRGDAFGCRDDADKRRRLRAALGQRFECR